MIVGKGDCDVFIVPNIRLGARLQLVANVTLDRLRNKIHLATSGTHLVD